jgi:S-adenosylmethionine hydrolase
MGKTIALLTDFGLRDGNVAAMKGVIYSIDPEIRIVDPGVGSKRDILCVETDDYYFLAPDNGLLKFILGNEKINT